MAEIQSGAAGKDYTFQCKCTSGSWSREITYFHLDLCLLSIPKGGIQHSDLHVKCCALTSYNYVLANRIYEYQQLSK